jgi:hypothetical protein
MKERKKRARGENVPQYLCFLVDGSIELLEKQQMHCLLVIIACIEVRK